MRNQERELMDRLPQRKLTTDEVDAILDGTADDDLKERVAQNKEYQQQVEEAQLVDAMLTNRLFRNECPDHDVLMDYHLKHLSKQETEQLENHLERCPLCPEELAELSAIWDENDAIPGEHQTQSKRIISITEHPSYQQGHVEYELPQRKVRGSSGLQTNDPRKLQIQAQGIELNVLVKEQLNIYELAFEIIADDDQVWHSAMLYVEEPNGHIHTATFDNIGTAQITVNTGPLYFRVVSELGAYLFAENIQLDG